MTRKIFEYLLLGTALALSVVIFFLEEKDLLKAIHSVLPDMLAVLLAFIVVHFLFSRRNISVAEVAGYDEARNNLRKRVVPASRRLEKAMQRASEVLAIVYQNPSLSSSLMQQVLYQHQVMHSDIFESYITLSNAWSTKTKIIELAEPILKSKEFAAQALEHSNEMLEAIDTSENEFSGALKTAFRVLNQDLERAIALLDLETDTLTEND